MATRPVLAAKLSPSYAEVHSIEDEEAHVRLERALAGGLWETLLGYAWTGLLGRTQKLDEAGLLEKVARSLGERPLRPGKPTPEGPAWSAFWLQVDLAAGTASDMAKKVLESDAGKQMTEKGFEEAGRFLAAELTR